MLRATLDTSFARSRAARLVIVSAALTLGCTPKPRITAEYAPTFSARSTTVSVFGAYRDGRMNEGAWEQIGPSLSKPLQSSMCAAGYGDELRTKQPDLARAIDHDAREEGLSEELFDKLAPFAQGELVMAVTLYKYVPPAIANRGTAASTSPMQMGTGGSQRRGMGGMGGGPGGAGMGGGRPPPQNEEEKVFEVSVALFSVKEHHVVARVDLRYSGDDVDRALSEYEAKLAAVLPQSRCVGWSLPQQPPAQ